MSTLDDALGFMHRFVRDAVQMETVLHAVGPDGRYDTGVRADAASRQRKCAEQAAWWAQVVLAEGAIGRRFPGDEQLAQCDPGCIVDNQGVTVDHHPNCPRFTDG